jgi:hypothetical protein
MSLLIFTFYLTILTALASIISIATTVVTFGLAIFWSKLKGYRTQILKILSILIGFIALVGNSILPFLASTFNVDITTAALALGMVLAFINLISGKIEAMPPAELLRLPERLMMNKEQVADDVKRITSKANSNADANVEMLKRAKRPI